MSGSGFQPQPGAATGRTTSDPPPPASIAVPRPASAFAVAWRGYDRQQVDGYLARLIARLATVERARAQLERTVGRAGTEEATSLSPSLSPDEQLPSFARLGVDIGEVLAQAGRSAELLVDKAKGHAEALVAAAQARADALVRAAQQLAEQVDQAARQRLVEVQAETQQAQAFRDGLTQHLGRIRADIDALLAQMATFGGQAPQAAADPDAAAAAVREPTIEAEVEAEAENKPEEAPAPARSAPVVAGPAQTEQASPPVQPPAEPSVAAPVETPAETPARGRQNRVARAAVSTPDPQRDPQLGGASGPLPRQPPRRTRP